MAILLNVVICAVFMLFIPAQYWCEHHNQSIPDSCPKSCSCSNGVSIVDCSKGHLKLIPDLPKSVEVLLLDNNPLGTIYPEAFRNLTRIQLLSLQNCNLSTIQPQTFNGLTSLSKLMLSKNQLKQLPNELFSAANKIAYLLLNNNPITLSSVGSILPCLSHLKLLDISHNAIDGETELPEEFSILSDLRTLVMDNSRIRITSNYFLPLVNSSLEYLSMRASQLTNVSEMSLTPLSHLKTLDISYSSISMGNAMNLIKSLQNTTKLETLLMDGIQMVKSNLHKNLFQPLHHIHLKNLSLQGNLMFDGVLQPKLFKALHSLEVLKLDFCGLHSVSSDAFNGLKKIKSISLSGNFISCRTSDECGFLHKPNYNPHHSLENLISLDLSGNNIQTITGKTVFRGGVFQNLKSLSLLGNKIVHLPKGMFVEMNSLQKLDISGNPISVIDQDWLEGMDNLMYLHLNNSNMLVTLGPKIFQGAKELLRLDLHACDINDIHPLAFKGLRRLEYLNLRGNTLMNKAQGIKMESPSLWKVDLGINLLTSIPDFVPTISNLTHLFLDYNLITDSNLMSLSGLSSVEVLDLSFNSILQLKKEFLEQHPQLRRMSFENNPFYCGCDFEILDNYFNQSHIEIVNRDNHVCQAPLDERGVSIFKYCPSYWHCKAKAVAVPFICMFCMLIVFGIFLLLPKIGLHIEWKKDCCSNCYFLLKPNTEICEETEDYSTL